MPSEARTEFVGVSQGEKFGKDTPLLLLLGCTVTSWVAGTEQKAGKRHRRAGGLVVGKQRWQVGKGPLVDTQQGRVGR